MTTKQKFAQELQEKQERISAWESSGLPDKDYNLLNEEASVEYWYVD